MEKKKSNVSDEVRVTKTAMILDWKGRTRGIVGKVSLLICVDGFGTCSFKLGFLGNFGKWLTGSFTTYSHTLFYNCVWQLLVIEQLFHWKLHIAASTHWNWWMFFFFSIYVSEGANIRMWSADISPKSRRGILRRAVFSEEQRKELERTFRRQKYISKTDRNKLAADLSLKESQVTEHKALSAHLINLWF